MKKSRLLNWKTELIRVCTIFKDSGIDIQKIPVRKTLPNGKRVPTVLMDVNTDKADINKTIIEYGITETFPLGDYISRYRSLYNNRKLTQEECELGESLGIVIKRNKNVSEPIFKGRKISQFHLDYINGILDKILKGQINTVEALGLLRQASIENNETLIDDPGSIKRCVEILLKDRPEELKTYQETLKKNPSARSMFRGEKEEAKAGLYYEREEKFKKTIIEHYLPLLISGRITVDKIEQELSTTYHTINKTIEEFYTKNNDLEGLREYQEAKKRNVGASLETRENAKTKRDKVANYNVVTDSEFLCLSPEEQDRQIMMKFRKEKLKEEIKVGQRTRVTSEEIVLKYIQKIKDFFRKKNDPKRGVENFSEQDIRYMLFRYPSILGRDTDSLDKKINVLVSYDDIDEKTAYGMIKTFPAIIGYSPERIKSQLDLLQRENLIDCVISKPIGMMRSASLMYALIEYAKQRHKTTDLSNVSRSNIFMANSILKRLYGTTYKEIKEKFPYKGTRDEEDVEYSINGQEIGQAVYQKGISISQIDKAFDVVKEISDIQVEKEI